MDTLAKNFSHFFLSILQNLGMESVVNLFGDKAYWCAVRKGYFGQDSLEYCNPFLGYALIIAIVAVVFLRKKFQKKSEVNNNASYLSNTDRNLTIFFGVLAFGAVIVAYQKYLEYGFSRFIGSGLAVILLVAISLHFYKKWKKY